MDIKKNLAILEKAKNMEEEGKTTEAISLYKELIALKPNLNIHLAAEERIEHLTRGEYKSSTSFQDEKHEDELNKNLSKELSKKGLKKCHYCAETVKFEAIKCRYCQSELNENKLKTDSNITVGDGMRNGLGIIITLVLIFIVLIIITKL